MAWTIPKTWTAAVVTVAELNAHIRDNLNILKTSLADDGTVLGELKGYKETQQTVAIAAGVVTINLVNGSHVSVALNANITSFVVTNFGAAAKITPVVLYFTADGTPRTITFSVNGKTVKFPGGVAPTPTSTNNKVDKVVLYTRDGDTSWYGEVGGQNA